MKSWIKIVTIYKNFFSKLVTMIFFYKISSSLVNRKEPEPQFVPNFGSERPINFAPGPGSTTLPPSPHRF